MMTRLKMRKMKFESNYRIRSINDLNRAKQELRNTIAIQEQELLDHPVISIPLSLLETSSIKGSVHTALESISLENYKNALMSLLGTFLLANRKTRKFFIGFVIAKELVPYAIQKIEEMRRK